MLDYLITEAVAIKAAHEDDKNRKEAERAAEMKQKKKNAIEELRNKFR